MPASKSHPKFRKDASGSRLGAQALLRALDQLTQGLQPGDPLPTQLELIRQYNASERAVRWALDELRRQGKVISKRRVGTVVTERHATQGHQEASRQPGVWTDSRTIVAIATPGQSVFTRALNLLFNQAESARLALLYRLFNPEVSNIPHGEAPLGYILFGRELIPLAKRLQDAGQRVVLVGTPYATSPPGVPCVYGDQEHGGYLVTRHLLDLGHRRIAFRGPADWQQMRRWRGHREALSEARAAGTKILESTISDQMIEEWRRDSSQAVEHFRASEGPTAVIAWNDQTAMSLLTLLSYSGIRVPQDVSLVGYDNLPATQQVHPNLTTVDIALEQQLRAALRLLSQPEPPAPTQESIITSTLIQRESTREAIN